MKEKRAPETSYQKKTEESQIDKKQVVERIKQKKSVSVLYFVLRGFVMITLVFQFIRGNYENVFMCVLTLVLFLLPAFVERRLNIDLPNLLEIIVLLFIFSAQILGEINEFYISIPHWDTMLHTINGFICAAIGFAMVDILNSNDKISLRLSPIFMAVVAFCFSMTIGILWEFFEYGMDTNFNRDMQKDSIINSISSVKLDPNGGNTAKTIDGITDVIIVANGEEIPLGLGGYLDIGINDTMKDLLVNFIGAVVFSTIGFFYVKTRGRGKAGFVKGLIPTKRHSWRDPPPGSSGRRTRKKRSKKIRHKNSA